jgi:hypothetical protein
MPESEKPLKGVRVVYVPGAGSFSIHPEVLRTEEIVI